MTIKIILISIIGLFSNFNINSNTFCDGFTYGYKDGYCFNNPYCLTPLTPLCPLRTINEQDTYSDGYKRGFYIDSDLF